MNCIFCGIIDQSIPATIVYEDDKVIAFNDLSPRAPIHQLIIPRKHIATLNDLDEEDSPIAGHMLFVAQQLAKSNQIANDGYRVVMNCNSGAGQTVFHLHLHLLGGRPFQWPPG